MKSKDTDILENLYEQVIEKNSVIQEANVMDMIQNAWDAVIHAKTYAELAPNDKMVIDTFWGLVKDAISLLLFFGLGYPIVSELIKIGQSFLKVKNKRSTTFIEKFKAGIESLKELKNKVAGLPKGSKEYSDVMMNGHIKAEQIKKDLEKDYAEFHNNDIEAQGENLVK